MSKANKIKLVQIIADSDLSGGPRHVLGLLSSIDKLQFECFLICPKGYLSNETRKLKGVTVINVEMDSKYDFGAAFDIRSVIEKIRAKNNPFGPIIVHTHGPRAGLLGRKFLPQGVLSVYTEHRWDADYHLENRFNEWLQIKTLKYQNYKTDLIIAVSSSVWDFLIKRKLAPKNRLRLIPNAINAHKAISEKPKINDLKKVSNRVSNLIIGSVGNLNKQKGYEYLLEAMPKIIEKYPHIMLEIIGEGEERHNLKIKALQLGISRHITLLGRKEKPEEKMERWQLFISSSIAETFGIVILEAYNIGLPVVATKVGGVMDVVEHNKTGLLVKPRDADGLAEAVLKLLERPALAAKLKRGGYEKVLEFDWKVIIKKIEQEYENLLRS